MSNRLALPADLSSVRSRENRKRARGRATGAAALKHARRASVSPRHDEFRWREYRGHPSVLPATAGAAHAPTARRALLRARAADVYDFPRVWRALVRRAVGAVRRRLRGR